MLRFSFSQLVKMHKPPQNTIDYFRSTPWTREILENNGYQIIPFFSRHLNEHTGENRFFAQTVNSKTTIPHLLALQLKDLKPPGLDSRPCRFVSQNPAAPHSLICLVSLGRGLDSHPSIVHGGFQGVLFDEIMRNLILLNHNSTCESGRGDIHFTVNMNVSYASPVTTPGVFLLRSQLTKREGGSGLHKLKFWIVKTGF
ncbi:unnamed protein product [Penicillium salamii]|uniref:Thioesterase domain-containing protein n=1 Tax=Penicillium salamii TaxID=1612424 RepID=A0A9W4IYA4_9EURO|nr:unnamed protein product [Penicillium salamii]